MPKQKKEEKLPLGLKISFIVLIICFFIILFLINSFFKTLIEEPADPAEGDGMIAFIEFGFVIILIFPLVILFLVSGALLLARKPSGREMSIVVLLLFLFLAFPFLIRENSPTIIYVLAIINGLGMIFLIIYLGFNKKVKEIYSNKKK